MYFSPYLNEQFSVGIPGADGDAVLSFRSTHTQDDFSVHIKTLYGLGV